jgi:translation initiation factor IF-3
VYECLFIIVVAWTERSDVSPLLTNIVLVCIGAQAQSTEDEEELAGPDKSEQLALTHKKAQIIDENGKNLGVLSSAEALAMSKSRRVNMVQVRDAEIPVWRFEAKLTERERDKAKKKKTSEGDDEMLRERTKEIRLSDKITEHDLQTKVSKATQHLLTKHRVKVALYFKRRDEFDPQVGKAIIENVVLRLADICIVETQLKLVDDRSCFVTIRPISRRQLIAKGIIEAPIKEISPQQVRKEAMAERQRQHQIERERLIAEGLLIKKFLSPEEQARIALEEKAAGKRSVKNDDDDEFSSGGKKKRRYEEDDDDEDIEFEDFDEDDRR